MAEGIQRFWSRNQLGQLFGDFGRKGWFAFKFACLIRCFREYGIDLTLCVGPSMLPTFNERGDLVLMEHYSVFAEKIQTGDIVVAKNMQSPRYVVCKRVLGLQGDQVIVRPSTGTELPYTTTIPKGHVWLQGDNTINSTDSRQYGPVPYSLLYGRVFLKVWPLREAGWIASPA